MSVPSVEASNDVTHDVGKEDKLDNPVDHDQESDVEVQLKA